MLFTKHGVNNVVSDRSICDTNWHHVAYVYNPDDNIYFYIDGAFDSKKAYTSTFTTGLRHFVGSDQTSNNNWNGTIDELAIYNRSLTA